MSSRYTIGNNNIIMSTIILYIILIDRRVKLFWRENNVKTYLVRYHKSQLSNYNMNDQRIEKLFSEIDRQFYGQEIDCPIIEENNDHEEIVQNGCQKQLKTVTETDLKSILNDRRQIKIIILPVPVKSHNNTSIKSKIRK